MSRHPSRGPRRTAFLQAGLAFAVMLGTIVAASVFNQRVVASTEQSRQLLMRAGREAKAVHCVVSALTDIQAGEHGFVLTGDPADLVPYSNGLRLLATELGSLDTLSAGSEEMNRDAQDLRAGARDVAAEAKRVLGLAREQGRDAAIAGLRTGRGREAMEMVHDRAGRMLSRLDEDHEARLQDLRARQTLASRAGLATATLCAMLLGFTVLGLLRGRILLLRAQAELGELTARLSGTITHLRDGIAVFGSDGGLLIWNHQLVDLAQLPSGALRIGEPIERIIAAAWPLATLAPPARDAPTVEEIHVGPRTLDIWRGWMPDDGQILLVADTTRRTRAESIARQAQKMEALGQLTGGVAHDFNNLLQVISANLELIGLRVGGNPTVTDRLAAALSAVERAARLTRHLLAFARRQPLAPEAINTACLLRGAHDMLLRALGAGINITLRLDPGLWPIRADPQQLESAILNLAINARDAMDGHGCLIITASNATVEDAEAATLPDLGAGRYVAISITDTGIGMTPEELSRALEPFYTTKQDGRGTGLGLPMVFGFAKQSHGHLSLWSEPGRGTTARLYLPRSDKAPEAKAEKPAQLVPAQGELVLIVEDEESVRISAREALHGLGYRTVEVETATAALLRLREGLRPDLLLTDIVMPGTLDARAMVQRARQLVPGLAVVYTTGDAEAAGAQGGDIGPGGTMVVKPWRTRDLAKSLRHALDTAGLPGAANAPPAVRRLRVVLAEDDDQVREMAAELLTNLGHEVVEAGTGAAALREVEAGGDLLITDLELPDLDGLRLAARASAQRPEIAVIVASGHQPDASSHLAWLEKPYDAAALRAAIEHAVTRPLASRA